MKLRSYNIFLIWGTDILWTLHFGSCASTRMAWLVFLFWKNDLLLFIFIFLENDLESLLIFVLFLKGKQNKKEKL